MPILKTKNNVEFEVDQEDLQRVNQTSWHTHTNGYIVSSGNKTVGNPRNKKVYLHRFLLGAVDGRIVDHKDGNKLNNTKQNLRFVSAAQNTWNSRGKGRIFKGVRKCSRGPNYFASIMINNKSIYLGTFSDPQLAAQEYDKAALLYHGEFSRLNFKE